MEPIILELEREENDLLIIAHESVLRVLYGYLMACNAADIPKLEFPRDEIIEVNIQYHTQTVSNAKRLPDHPLKLQQRRQADHHPRPARQHRSWQPRGYQDARPSERNRKSTWHWDAAGRLRHRHTTKPHPTAQSQEGVY